MQIDQIKLYEKNAKEHPKWHLDKIASSIKAFGCKQPIVLDKNGVIVAGHGRFLAMTELLGYTVLKELAYTKKGEAIIPYLSADDLTDDEVKAYRLADNQINALTNQDMALVKEELKLLDESGFDITLTGFDRDLIIDDDDKDDILPAEKKEPISKIGDVYILGDHVLMCGDSTIKENWEKIMQGRKADMVFTDPPYNVNYSGRGENTSNGIMNDNMKSSEFDLFLSKVFKEISDNTKQGGGVVCFPLYKYASPV